MKSILILLLSCSLTPLFAQRDTASVRQFSLEKEKITRAGMYTLGAWSLGNFAVSGVGWARGTGSNKYFHMGNVLWNTVNFAIAVPGIIMTYRSKPVSGYFAAWKKQKQTETVYWANAALDLVYISGGFGLRALSNTPVKPINAMRWEGFGNALLLQGAFLLLYDVSLLTAHKLHAARKLDKIQPFVSASPGGFYASLRF
ncbi:MAG: hypothetical protein IBJ09_16230 [Bacteroidia bacterium]|nr:hypothetical protein [Bacteroidia bacterium]